MRSYQGLSFSLVLHILVAWLLWKLPMPLAIKPPQNIVELIESSPADKAAFNKKMSDEKTFVMKAKPPKELLTDKREKPARFSSEDEQNVLEEQKAHNSGLTANRSEQSQTQKALDFAPQPLLKKAIRKDMVEEKQEEKQASSKAEKLLGKGEGDVRVGGMEKPDPSQSKDKKANRKTASQPLVLPNFMGAEKGTSTVGEMLPDDMKFGDFTALNTDRNLYYSFYSRMEEAIRPPWVRYARAALYAYQTGARKLQGNETWATKVEVLLDPKGDYVKAIVHESSGVRELDLAPVQAFRESKQFPHPPPEMVKKDGYIHIYCMFTVNVSPQYATGAE